MHRLAGAIVELRAVDYQHGGGACGHTLSTLLAGAERMLAADVSSGTTVDRLRVVTADLHNLTGWAAFDTGRLGRAWRCFDRALELARHTGRQDLVANIHYRRGRVHLHHHAPEQALAEFQLGQAAAGPSGSALEMSILYANQAWAYAVLGDAGQALTLLGKAGEQFALAERAEAPSWAGFFNETDFAAMTGIVHAELARSADPAYATTAIGPLSTATAAYGQDMARSRTFTLTALATAHLIDGDHDAGVTTAVQALELVGSLTSTRTRDRMRPLKTEADKHPAHAHTRELSEQLATATRAPGR
ncbi:hypothetical protein [Amycolatopsis nigrescens]|uniref:hypothetical protein n=1 Tax=Amycolatopsis nigrescens TaxID=381445 RepID=UPI0003702A21|nr:hypothetical protein [Amycolatopsis nigrescens]